MTAQRFIAGMALAALALILPASAFGKGRAFAPETFPVHINSQNAPRAIVGPGKCETFGIRRCRFTSPLASYVVDLDEENGMRVRGTASLDNILDHDLITAWFRVLRMAHDGCDVTCVDALIASLAAIKAGAESVSMRLPLRATVSSTPFHGVATISHADGIGVVLDVRF